jgi:hypothetical protein|tara:strand:+ start:4092 stop:4370 length:279 start_codon:yes stop_codon:yes gene_type:complete
MASISFTSPTSSTTWDKLDTVTISWNKTPASGTWGDQVLYLYKGSSFEQTIVSNLSGTASSYSWTIPEGLDSSSSYTIQIHTTHDDGGGGSP